LNLDLSLKRENYSVQKDTLRGSRQFLVVLETVDNMGTIAANSGEDKNDTNSYVKSGL